MSKKPLQYQYFCVPESPTTKNRTVGRNWYLFKEPQTQIGKTNWSYTPPGGPTLVASRKAGSRIWYKAKSEYYGNLDIMWSRREDVPYEEALAMILAAR